MIAVAENVFSSSLAWLRRARPVLLLLVFAGFRPYCFGQLPADLDLPSETLDSGTLLFQASNSITNSSSFVVQDSASVTLRAGSYIRLEPGFHAVAGSAPSTLFAVIDPNVTPWPPTEGDGPPSIPFSYTAPTHAPTCDNISGQWIDSDNVGNSIGWDLNQSGNSITGTLSYDDYRDFGYGLTYCGTISYSASGVSNGTSFSLSAVNPVPSIDSCGLPLYPSETETVTLSGLACGSGAGAYTISDGGGGTGLRANQTPTRATIRRIVNPTARSAVTSNTSISIASGQSGATSNAVHPEATSGTSAWTTYSPRFNVSYASYIPNDHIVGPSPCRKLLLGYPVDYPLIYKGDAYRGTFRTTQSIFVVPAKQFSNNFAPETGASRNYSVGSPANGHDQNLSSTPATSDIYNGPYIGADEDNTPDDCILWNEKGKADLSAMQTHGVTFPSSNQAVVTLSGSASDPLEPKIGSVDWIATITLNATDANNPTAQVSITHTCYPAHTVKVNGVTLLDDQPAHSNLAYMTLCLLDPTHKTNTKKTTDPITVPKQ